MGQVGTSGCDKCRGSAHADTYRDGLAGYYRIAVYGHLAGRTLHNWIAELWLVVPIAESNGVVRVKVRPHFIRDAEPGARTY